MFALFSGLNTIKPELNNHAICLEGFLTLLSFECKQRIYPCYVSQEIIFKDWWADNRIKKLSVFTYGNLRDFTRELSSTVLTKLNSIDEMLPKLFIIFIVSFLFLFQAFGLYFFDLFISCFQLFANNNLQLNLFICVLYSKKVFSSSFLSGKKWMSTNNSTESRSEFGPYLAGLLESDGSIIVPKDSVSTPTIKIVFNIKDKPLAKCLD